VIKYREIMRLHTQGLSNRSIESSCGCTRNPVGDVLKRAQELHVPWPFEREFSYEYCGKIEPAARSFELLIADE
jgi:hypothetical protein